MSASAPTSVNACAKSISLQVPGKRRTATFIIAASGRVRRSRSFGCDLHPELLDDGVREQLVAHFFRCRAGLGEALGREPHDDLLTGAHVVDVHAEGTEG